jgi:RES domain-containing protein
VIVWRFSQHRLLDGRGGLLASGRWHTRGREILYCAPNPATALLEVIVHGAVRDVTAFAHFQFLKIDVPDSLATGRIDEMQLGSDWPLRFELTRAQGDQWLREAPNSVLEVRSVLVPETYNVLINPRHADARQITLLDALAFPLDPRLFAPTVALG